MIAVATVVLGLLVAAAAVWMVHPLWALVPAALLVLFGFWVDVDRG